MLTGGGDRTARLWDAGSGKELRPFVGRSASVLSAAFSPDGRYVLTGNADNTARLWDTRSGNQLRQFVGHREPVASVAFSPDSRLVLTGSGDGTARLWEASTGRESARFRWAAPVVSVTFSPDGHQVLAGSGDGAARFWEVNSGKILRSLNCRPIRSMAISPDGHQVLTSSFDDTARLWDVSTGKELRSFVGHSASVASVAFSPDGDRVLIGTNDGIARLWDVGSGKELRSFVGHSGSVASVAFSPDGHQVLTGSYDDTARLWDAGTGKELLNFEAHSAPVVTVAFSPDGRLALTGSSDGTTRLWDVSRATQLVSLVGFYNGTWAVTDPDGHYDAPDPDASESVYWVTDNLRTIDLGQLKREYYTPGLLSRVIRGERLPDVTGMDQVQLPPQLFVTQQYEPGTKKLGIKIKNDGGGIGRIQVQVDGRLLRVIEKHGKVAVGQAFFLLVALDDAPFVVGDNTIRVTAYDAGNRIESQPILAHYVLGNGAKGVTPAHPSDSMNVGRFYAIVVGTSKFGDPKMDLTFPSHDAANIAEGLRLGAERLYGEDRVWVRMLTSDSSPDSLPTKANIRAAFDEVRAKAKPDDTLLIYFSGHGVTSSRDRDTYYYLTEDARTLNLEDDSHLRDISTVSSAELFHWLREPKKTMPLKQIIILDTCAAGAAGKKLAEERDIPPDQRRAIELLKDATGTFILMGSAADAVSYEASKYGQGLLTYALIDGMRGRALVAGSRLDVGKWFDDASEEVPDLAKGIGGMQKPVIARPQGREFPVIQLLPDDIEKIPFATIKPQLLHLICADAEGLDPIQLRSVLREQLRLVNDTEAPVYYLDEVADDLPGAISTNLLYSKNSDTVAVRIRMIQNDKKIAEAEIEGSALDVHDLAKKLANKIIAMATATQPDGGRE